MTEHAFNATQSSQFSPFFDLDGFLARIEQAVKKAVKQPILAQAVYDYDELVEVSGFSKSTIIRADRRGDLLGRYEGRRRYFLGSDVLAWLTKGEGEDH